MNGTYRAFTLVRYIRFLRFISLAWSRITL
jgi:hypothetical protein